PSCNQFHGIYIATGYATVQNNIVWDVGGYGIHLWHAATHVTVANNDVDHCRQGGILVGAGDAPGGVTNDYTMVSNNIVRDNATWGIREYGATGPNNRYLNNDVYNNPTPYALLTGVQSGGISANPLYTTYNSAGGGDYHVQAGSPVIDAGTSI